MQHANTNTMAHILDFLFPHFVLSYEWTRCFHAKMTRFPTSSWVFFSIRKTWSVEPFYCVYLKNHRNGLYIKQSMIKPGCKSILTHGCYSPFSIWVPNFPLLLLLPGISCWNSCLVAPSLSLSFTLFLQIPSQNQPLPRNLSATSQSNIRHYFQP